MPDEVQLILPGVQTIKEQPGVVGCFVFFRAESLDPWPAQSTAKGFDS